MSLYREARSGRRRLWLAAGAALVVVAVLVAVLLRGGDPSAADRLESLQEDVRPALAALELVPIHYESPNATTHAAAADQLEVARETVGDLVDELRARDPGETQALLADLDRLGELVRTTGRADEVEEATRETAARLRRLVGLD